MSCIVMQIHNSRVPRFSSIGEYELPAFVLMLQNDLIFVEL